MEKLTNEELDYLISKFEQIRDSLDNVLSFTEELGDISINFDKFTEYEQKASE